MIITNIFGGKNKLEKNLKKLSKALDGLVQTDEDFEVLDEIQTKITQIRFNNKDKNKDVYDAAGVLLYLIPEVKIALEAWKTKREL